MSKKIWIFLTIVICLLAVSFSLMFFGNATNYQKDIQAVVPAQNTISPAKPVAPLIPPLDIALYNQKLMALANNPPDPSFTTP